MSPSSTTLSPRKVPVPTKYAPKAWLHKDEKAGPLSPETFLAHSDLTWYSTGRKILMSANPNPEGVKSTPGLHAGQNQPSSQQSQARVRDRGRDGE